MMTPSTETQEVIGYMDASLSVISKNGQIIEIVVEGNGSNYYASQIYVEGSGTEVVAFPVFDEYGLNTSVIFDDLKLKNLEQDKIPRPSGAGQGFQEDHGNGTKPMILSRIRREADC